MTGKLIEIMQPASCTWTTLKGHRTGIINNPKTFPNIDKHRIVELNERGEENISAGSQAIEFLLRGQDRSTAGPGDRPVTDFTTAKNADRRKSRYLESL